jgi:hypothetical protein
MTQTNKTALFLAGAGTILIAMALGCDAGDGGNAGATQQQCLSIGSCGGTGSATGSASDAGSPVATATPTTTDTGTGVSTGTDTTGVPSWCASDAYASIHIGQPIYSTFWVATCAGVAWNIYILYNEPTNAKVRGYGFKASDMDAAPMNAAVPSQVQYNGTSAVNCLYLVPSDTSAPTITASTMNANGGSGGNCTVVNEAGSLTSTILPHNTEWNQ